MTQACNNHAIGHTMKAFIFVVAFAAVSAIAEEVSDAELTEKWAEWKIKHTRNYSCEEEDICRSEIFKDNSNRINEHNMKYERGEVSYSKGINLFSDMTSDEWAIKQSSMWGPGYNPEVGNSAPTSEDKFLTTFKHYTTLFRKDYVDREDKCRMEILRQNWNSLDHLEDISFSMGINQFSDMTEDEWTRKNITRFNVTDIPETTSPTGTDTDAEFPTTWEAFQGLFEKDYVDGEHECRREIFRQNWYKLGSLEDISFTTGINQFSDMTEGEWIRKNITRFTATDIPELDSSNSTDANNGSTSEWEDWKLEHDRSYTSEKEEDCRSAIFLENLNEINEHNMKYELGEVSYFKGTNQFSDLTTDEWIRKQEGRVDPEDNPDLER